MGGVAGFGGGGSGMDLRGRFTGLTGAEVRAQHREQQTPAEVQAAVRGQDVHGGGGGGGGGFGDNNLLRDAVGWVGGGGGGGGGAGGGGGSLHLVVDLSLGAC